MFRIEILGICIHDGANAAFTRVPFTKVQVYYSTNLGVCQWKKTLALNMS